MEAEEGAEAAGATNGSAGGANATEATAGRGREEMGSEGYFRDYKN